MELADTLFWTFRCMGLRLLRCMQRRTTMQRTAGGPQWLQPWYPARRGGCFASSPAVCPLSNTPTTCRACRPE